MRTSTLGLRLAPPLAAVLALALVACSGSRGSGSGGPVPGDGADTGTSGGPATPVADGAPCLASTDCESGVCEGEGCGTDQPGTCVASSRACTRDLRPYCGCDGETFRTSGSCAGKRFAFRGECEAGPGSESQTAP